MIEPPNTLRTRHSVRRPRRRVERRSSRRSLARGTWLDFVTRRSDAVEPRAFRARGLLKPFRRVGQVVNEVHGALGAATHLAANFLREWWQTRNWRRGVLALPAAGLFAICLSTLFVVRNSRQELLHRYERAAEQALQQEDRTRATLFREKLRRLKGDTAG